MRVTEAVAVRGKDCAAVGVIGRRDEMHPGDGGRLIGARCRAFGNGLRAVERLDPVSKPSESISAEVAPLNNLTADPSAGG